MTYKEFSNKLEELGLSRKDFSNLTGHKYRTVLEWVRPTKKIPEWVDSWLNLYEKAKKYDELINKIKD
jgi:hypothetical protein